MRGAVRLALAAMAAYTATVMLWHRTTAQSTLSASHFGASRTRYAAVAVATVAWAAAAAPVASAATTVAHEVDELIKSVAHRRSKNNVNRAMRRLQPAVLVHDAAEAVRNAPRKVVGAVVARLRQEEPSAIEVIVEHHQLLLEKVEDLVPVLGRALLPVWQLSKLLFGVSILFYGMEFPTTAFHIICFRISGYKTVVKHWRDLVAHYRKARAATEAVARNTLTLTEALAQQKERREEREHMLSDREEMLRDGRITAEEARSFIARHRQEIRAIAQQQDQLVAASSSIMALRTAIPWKAVWTTVRDLHAALVTSVTASTFKAAGRFTMALYCGDVLRDDFLALLGPAIDPLSTFGESAEIGGALQAIMMGPAAARATFVAVVATALLLVTFYNDPEWALQMSLCFLGANVVLTYVQAVLARILRLLNRKEVRRLNRSPFSALLHLMLTALGWVLHGRAGGLVHATCLPFIAALLRCNDFLNRFKVSTVNFFN